MRGRDPLAEMAAYDPKDGRRPGRVKLVYNKATRTIDTVYTGEPGAASYHREQPPLLGVLLSILIGVLCVALAIGAIFIVLSGPAKAHDAIPTAAKPDGWSYPFSCCSGYDCRPVADVEETSAGYVVRTGEVIPYSGDTRLKNSPDGTFHWCSEAGADDGRTICLYAPPRSF